MSQPLGSPPKDSIYYGPYATLSDAVTIGTVFQKGLSKYILVAGAGNIVYENESNELQFIAGVSAGSLLPIVARRIVASGTVRGTPRTTTATNMSWLGGY